MTTLSPYFTKLFDKMIRIVKVPILSPARTTALCILLAVLLVYYSLSARAQESSNERPIGKVTVDYVEPRDETLLPIYKNLRQRSFLEQFQQLLAPFQLKTSLRLKTIQCGRINAFYSPSERAIYICYEYVQDIEEKAPSGSISGGIVRQDIIAGNLAGIVLHEIGHAIFDNLQVPLLGREEDAADEFSAYMALQFDSDVALTIINGRAYHFHLGRENSARLGAYVSDEHAMNIQRLQNYICLAYGAKPDVFRSFIENGPLSKSRTENCSMEYQRVKLAFEKTIMPSVDLTMMKKIHSTDWLKALRNK